MYDRKPRNTTSKLLILGAVLTTLLATGCNSTNQTAVWAEPDPAEALVYNGPGLSACDALGHQVFVDQGYRFASARTVFEMAAAENPGLSLDNLNLGTAPAITIPEQVIVYGTLDLDEQPEAMQTVTVEVPTGDYE